MIHSPPRPPAISTRPGNRSADVDILSSISPVSWLRFSTDARRAVPRMLYQPGYMTEAAEYRRYKTSAEPDHR